MEEQGITDGYADDDRLGQLALAAVGRLVAQFADDEAQVAADDDHHLRGVAGGRAARRRLHRRRPARQLVPRQRRHVARCRPDQHFHVRFLVH